MSETIKVRAKAKDGVIQGKALIQHPMETGTRKDKKGELIPAHFIQKLTIAKGEEEIMVANWGPAVSKDPYIAFNFKGGSGDTFTLTWVDNKGETDSVETTVK